MVRSPSRQQVLFPFVLLGPPVAWLLTLSISYLGQDFACSAARSDGRALPGAGLTTALILINVALLLLALTAGLAGARLYLAGRSRQRADRTAGFVGLTGIVLTVLFSFGIVLIMVNPTVWAAC